MVSYQEMSITDLKAEQAKLQTEYEAFQSRGQKLNMARGKPSPNQLDEALSMLSVLPDDQRPLDNNGEDTRNYGIIRGIPEARALMGDILGVPAENVMVGNNASLTLMYDQVARAMLFGIAGCKPQSEQRNRRFLCPAPGYDRHFAISAAFGYQNIPIPMLDDGPDMDQVEQYMSDPAVKGIWCVPKYSNPQGITYSDQVVQRFAALQPAAPDFRIYWDNAYAVHDLYPGSAETDHLLNLKTASDEAQNPDIWLMFASTSKISFAGGGISAIASSEANLDEIEAHISIQTIGPDKVNQLRHVRWLESLGGGTGLALPGLKRHMQNLAALLAPKFQAVDKILASDLDGLGVASWTKPRGGYFISLEALPGTAKRTIALAQDAGVVLTEAGATWPGGNDPLDSNIRIAPSYPSLEELEQASQLLTICLRLAAVELLLQERS